LLRLLVFIALCCALLTQHWFVHGTEVARLGALGAAVFVTFALPAIVRGGD